MATTNEMKNDPKFWFKGTDVELITRRMHEDSSKVYFELRADSCYAGSFTECRTDGSIEFETGKTKWKFENRQQFCDFALGCKYEYDDGNMVIRRTPKHASKNHKVKPSDHLASAA